MGRYDVLICDRCGTSIREAVEGFEKRHLFVLRSGWSAWAVGLFQFAECDSTVVTDEQKVYLCPECSGKYNDLANVVCEAKRKWLRGETK